MFKTLKGLFTKKNKDLRKRIYFTIAVLSLYAIGTSIPIPNISGNVLDSLQSSKLGFLELVNVMGGGALKNMSIFALGVIPYITASIVVQLLQMDIIPYFKDLSKQGHTGQQKLNKITRYMGIIFALIQGYAMSYAFLGNSMTVLSQLEVAFMMTGGTAFLLWLGDQVTQKGYGNGTSLIIMSGILLSLPRTVKTAFSTFIPSFNSTDILISGGAKFLLFLIVFILVVIGVIYVEGAQRHVNIQYANKSTANLSKQTYMPIKINSAGVIPVIFASSLLAVPVTIAKFISNNGFENFVNKYISYTTPTGLVLYVVLIIFFDYFYTFVQMKPDKMAENLRNNGGYVPGIKPGKDTEDYFSKLLIRLTTSGSVFLALLAACPILINMIFGLDESVSVGGTGLLIVVGVAVETCRQIESSLLSRAYSASGRKRRARRA